MYQSWKTTSAISGYLSRLLPVWSSDSANLGPYLGPCTLAVCPFHWLCPFPLVVPLPTSQESMEPRGCALFLDYTLNTLKFPVQIALRLLPGLCTLFPRLPMYLYLGSGWPRGNRLEGLWKCAWPPMWCKMEPGMETKRESGQGSPVDLFSWYHTCSSLCQGTPLQLCPTGCSALPDVRLLWELAVPPQLFSRSWPLVLVLWFLHTCLNISTPTSKLLSLPQDFCLVVMDVVVEGESDQKVSDFFSPYPFFPLHHYFSEWSLPSCSSK